MIGEPPVITPANCPKCAKPGTYVRTRWFDTEECDVFECSNPACRIHGLIWHANNRPRSLVKYESKAQPGLFFWAEWCDMVHCWLVLSQVNDFPATEGWDDWMAKFSDADDIARKLADGTL